MSKKTYDSPIYYAQVFRNELKKHLFEKYGGEYPITHSNNIISFNISKITSHVTFEYKGKNPFLFLEMSLINGGGIERTKSVETKLDIKRSKTKRISENYPKTLEKFVLNEMKGFYKTWIK